MYAKIRVIKDGHYLGTIYDTRNVSEQLKEKLTQDKGLYKSIFCTNIEYNEWLLIL